MVMLTRNKTLLAKEESAYGSDPTPTVESNAIEARNIKISYKGDLLERDNIRGNIGAVQPVMGKNWIELTFDCDLKNGGTPGTACQLGDLLEACGYYEDVDVGSSIVYTPTSDDIKSVTFYVYDHISASSSRLHKITGARGNFSLKLTAGQMGVLSFTFKGKYNTPADIAHPATPTFESTIPPVVKSAAFEINSEGSLVVQEITIQSGNEIADEDDINDATGLIGFVLTGRKPSGNFNPEAVLVATYDFYGDWVAAAARDMYICVGSETGNQIEITAPKVTLDNIDEGDRNGIRTEEIPIRYSQDTGDDELEFVFS